jgi:CHRD domain
MDSTPVPRRNQAESTGGLNERWPALTWAMWHNTGRFLHRQMPSVGKGRVRLLSGTLVMAVALLVFSGCAAAQAAMSPAQMPGDGSRTFIAVFTPEGTNPYGTGTARLQLNPEQQTICFVILVGDIKLPATAADIHLGAAGINGPIMVYLRPPNAAGVSTGCTHAPRNLIVAIMQHPADYYVNVRNMPYPEGAVRGQLFLCTPNVAC